MEKIEDMLAYSLGVASKFVRWAKAAGVDMDDVKSAARLGLVEAMEKWREGEKEGSFKAYLAAVVDGKIREYLHRNGSMLSLGADSRVRGAVFGLMDEMGKSSQTVTNQDLEEISQKIGRPVSTVKAVFATAKTFSLDEMMGDDGSTFADVVPQTKGVTGSQAYRLTPEEILIEREESKTRNRYRHSPEIEEKLLTSWLEFLPKEHAQVIKHRWLYLFEGQKTENPYRTFCNKSHGGTSAGSKGLAMSPEKAEEIEKAAIDILRKFARKDFSDADFTRAVARVPSAIVERFIESVDDECAKMALRYRLCKKYSIPHKETEGKQEYVSLASGSLKNVARVWRKRLSTQAGCELSKEESEKIVEQKFSDACRSLAVQVCIAPEWVG